MAIPVAASVVPQIGDFDTSVSEVVDRRGHALGQRLIGERLTRQFDERVYQNDSGGAGPAAPTGLSAAIQ